MKENLWDSFAIRGIYIGFVGFIAFIGIHGSFGLKGGGFMRFHEKAHSSNKLDQTLPTI